MYAGWEFLTTGYDVLLVELSWLKEKDDGMDAPAHAALVRDFVNSARVRSDREDLATPTALATWLHEHGLTGRRRATTHEDLDVAIRLREGLRGALLAHVDPDCAECRLDSVTAELPMIVRFTGSEPALDATGDDVRAGLTRIVVAIARAHGDGSWARLKVCASEDCRSAYFDTSKNRSRAWCDMEVCGNRAKTRTFRERHAATATRPPVGSPPDLGGSGGSGLVRLRRQDRHAHPVAVGQQVLGLLTDPLAVHAAPER